MAKINKAKLQNRLGMYLVVSHLLIIGLLLVLPMISSITYDEILPVLAVVLPVTGVYFGAVVEFAIANQHVTSGKSRSVNPLFARLALLLPVVFGVLVVTTILLWAYSGSVTYQIFQNLVTSLESVLGVFVGFIVTALFRENRLELPDGDDAPGVDDQRSIPAA